MVIGPLLVVAVLLLGLVLVIWALILSAPQSPGRQRGSDSRQDTGGAGQRAGAIGAAGAWDHESGSSATPGGSRSGNRNELKAETGFHGLGSSAGAHADHSARNGRICHVPGCGHQNEPAARYCARCGAELKPPLAAG